ncbi:MAG: class B sortase [Coriobacteriia bacterium]|nr:class B sortase [Coriobacteriia bacterium]
MSKARSRAIRIANGAVNTAVLLAICILASFGGYALWDSDQVHRAAAATNYERYKPVPEAKSFDELIAINSDVIAWIEVYGTHIDYPVVQGTDNMRYINTNAEGKHSLSGAIFLDYQSSRDFSDFNSILYGHHMEKFTMFGEIGDFAKKDYFAERRYGMLFYEGKEHGLEFFAFVHADAYDKTIFKPGIIDTEEAQAYLQRIAELTVHQRNIDINAYDSIILLATCSAASTNGRDILIGRISDELFENPFIVEETSNYATPSGLMEYWKTLAAWIKLLVAIGLIIVLALLVSYCIKKKKKKQMAAQAIVSFADMNEESAQTGEVNKADPTFMSANDISEGNGQKNTGELP